MNKIVLKKLQQVKKKIIIKIKIILKMNEKNKK
jgi:hypothetical protein